MYYLFVDYFNEIKGDADATITKTISVKKNQNPQS